MHLNSEGKPGRQADEESRAPEQSISAGENAAPGPSSRSFQPAEDASRFFALSLHLFLIAGLDGTIRRVNPAWTEVLGYDTGALTGSSFLDLIHPDDLERTRQEAARLAVGGDTTYFENRFRCKSGEFRCLAWSATAVPASGLIYGVAHDITDKKAAEQAVKLANKRFRSLFDAIDSPVYVADMETYELLYVNQKTRSLLGNVEGELCYKALQDGKDAPCGFCTNDRLVDAAGNPTGPYVWEFKNTATGIWFHCIDRAVPWDDGRIVRVEIATDITDRKRMEDEVRYRADLERALVEVSTELLNGSGAELDSIIDRALKKVGVQFRADRSYIFLLHDDGRLMSNTHEWCADGIQPQMTGLQDIDTGPLSAWMTTLQKHEVINVPRIDELAPAWEYEREQLSAQGIKSLLVVPVLFADHLFGFTGFDSVAEHRAWTPDEIRVLTFLGNLMGGAIGHRQAQDALQQSQDQLERIAYYDPLTGLPNRRLLLDRARQAISVADRDETLLAVCYLDLDGFKPVNDTHGHEAGDELLVSVSERLTNGVRGGDTVARWGGDEFAILLNGLHDIEACAEILDRLLKVLAEPHIIRGQTFVVTASAGVTLYPADPEDSDTLLRHADQAMYLSKRQGRNTYHFFDPEKDRLAVAHREQLMRIAQAIDADEFSLAFQPIVNMRTGAVEGAEALIRWNHPQRGLLPPREFLPVVEGHDLLQRLDYWVLGQAIRQLEDWTRAGLHLRLSINVSARTLLHFGFIATVKDLLERHPDVDPQRVEIEILETEALEDLDIVSSVIRQGGKLGPAFALDDFGTGYSSLTYFRRLPAKVLKIDRTFVRDMLHDREDLRIVEGVIGLARAFERRVVAEGVETVDHGSMLLRLGCERGQGYGIARPMPAEKLLEWVKDYAPPAEWTAASASLWSPEELPLLSMEAEHRTWVAGIAAAIFGDEHDPLIELDPHKCRFGHWYESEGSKRYGHLPSYAALDPLHRRVHELGTEMVDAHKRGDTRVTKRIEELFAARDRMVAALCVLQAEGAVALCRQDE